MDEETVMASSRMEFLATVQQLTITTLERLNDSPRGKLMDEKETRMLVNSVTKCLKIWEKALAHTSREPCLEKRPRQATKQDTEATEKKG